MTSTQPTIRIHGPPLASDTGPVYGLTFCPGGKTLATTSVGAARLWNVDYVVSSLPQLCRDLGGSFAPPCGPSTYRKARRMFLARRRGVAAQLRATLTAFARRHHLPAARTSDLILTASELATQHHPLRR